MTDDDDDDDDDAGTKASRNQIISLKQVGLSCLSLLATSKFDCHYDDDDDSDDDDIDVDDFIDGDDDCYDGVL